MAEDSSFSPPPSYLAGNNIEPLVALSNKRSDSQHEATKLKERGLPLRNLTIRELLQSEATSSPARLTGSIQSDAMDIDSVEDDRDRRSRSVISLDDPDVRLAAEALGDLKADKVHSSRSSSIRRPAPYSSPVSNNTQNVGPSTQQTEPLLSLFTSSHPFLGNAINGSLSAYSSSKSYSPSFRYGAEFVERHIGSPVVNTVGTVGRRTGMEGGVRWLLSPPRNSYEGNSSTKEGATRSLNNAEETDLEKGLPSQSVYTPSSQRRCSAASFADSLPAYDENRAPTYDSVVSADADTNLQRSQPSNPNWPQRVIMSTSGLGVSMSDESLRSLKYCLSWLRWANVRLHKVVVSMKDVLDDWDRAQRSDLLVERTGTASGNQETAASKDKITEEALAGRVQGLKSEVLQTLRKVVDVVSTYAGAALPENARNLVRGQLISLPQRFRIASTAEPAADKGAPVSQTASSAHKVMVLAKEGLDMLGQVSNVVDGTICSAEDWCQRLGRRSGGEQSEYTVHQNEKPDRYDEKSMQSVDTTMTNTDAGVGQIPHHDGKMDENYEKTVESIDTAMTNVDGT